MHAKLHFFCLSTLEYAFQLADINKSGWEQFSYQCVSRHSHSHLFGDRVCRQHVWFTLLSYPSK